MGVALASRLVIYLLAYLFNALLDAGRSPSTLMCSWDCNWYLSIVDHGYDLQPHAHEDGNAANWTFFPLYPLLSKFISLITGLHPVVAAQIVSNCAFVIGLVILYDYCLKTLDVSTSRFIVTAFACSPLSLYFSAPYTEATYFLLMVAAIYLAWSDRWIWAGLSAAALSATRPFGPTIAFSLLIIAVQQYGWRSLLTFERGAERAAVALWLVPLGLSCFMLFLYFHIGDALAFANVQRAWGNVPQSPLGTLSRALSGDPIKVYGAVAAMLTLIAALYLVVKRYPAEAVILLFAVLLPLSVGAYSVPRYSLTLYPIFLALGLITKDMAKTRMVTLCVLFALTGFTVMSWVTGQHFLV